MSNTNCCGTSPSPSTLVLRRPYEIIPSDDHTKACKRDLDAVAVASAARFVPPAAARTEAYTVDPSVDTKCHGALYIAARIAPLNAVAYPTFRAMANTFEITSRTCSCFICGVREASWCTTRVARRLAVVPEGWGARDAALSATLSCMSRGNFRNCRMAELRSKEMFVFVLLLPCVVVLLACVGIVADRGDFIFPRTVIP